MLIMYVYFIKTMGSRSKIKIGKSRNPEKRLKTMQTGCPSELRLMGVIRCKSEKDAYRLEGVAHELFAKYRVSGEWFKNALPMVCKINDFIMLHDSKNKL